MEVTMTRSGESGLRNYLRSVRRHPLVLIAHLLLFLAIAAALAAPMYPVDPLKQDLMSSLMPPSFQSDPIFGNGNPVPPIFGTDSLGRDLVARILLAKRISLGVSVFSAAVAALLGVPLGLLSGYFGGLIDTVIMRIVDALLSLPFVVLAIAVVAAIGPGMTNVILVLGLTGWVTFAKLVRAEVLRIRESTFVESAHAIGCSNARILLRHILPQTLGIVLVNITLSMGQMIMSEATLSFLGLGIPLPTPTLGGILSEAQQTFFAGWWIIAIPGITLMLIVVSMNIVGDFLRDFYDPRLRA